MVGDQLLLTLTLVLLFTSAKTIVVSNSRTAISAVCLHSSVGEPACLIPDLRASLTSEPVSFEILYNSAVELEKAVDCESSVPVLDDIQIRHSIRWCFRSQLKFCQVKVTLPEDVDVAKETRDPSGSTNTSDVIYPWDSEQSENVCPCDFYQYERFCCPRGHAYAYGMDECVEDTLTPRARDIEGSIKNHLVVSQVLYNCDEYMYYSHSQYCSICVGKSKVYPYRSTNYCMYRELNTTNYRILGCTWGQYTLKKSRKHKGDDFIVGWLLICAVSASLIALATLIVYSLVPELKNFQGMIIRSYLASYCSCMIIMTVAAIFYLSDIWPDGWGSYVFALTVSYFGFACLLWLNVMSFDIWRTFREMRSSQAVNVKDRQRATFLRYSIYAWGTPVPLTPILVAISLEWIHIPHNVFVALSLPISGVFVSNICFYTLTAMKIKQSQKEIAQVVDEASKHHRNNEQWFNLYLRLFIIMGCPIVLWAVAFAFSSSIYPFMGVFTVEPLQAILVFYTFVWKDDVKRSIRKRFCFYRDSATTIQNKNEEL